MRETWVSRAAGISVEAINKNVVIDYGLRNILPMSIYYFTIRFTDFYLSID